MKNWREFFPSNLSPRAGQVKVIETALEGFENGKNTFLLEAPTGQGKSVIAMTIARYLASQTRSCESENAFHNGAYILTTQKILQEQYLRDFSKQEAGGLLELKSSTNYTCGYDPRQSCGESKRALTALGKSVNGTPWKDHCTRQCSYNQAKKSFIEGLFGTTNYSFFFGGDNLCG